MALEIKTMLDAVKGVKKDWKEDWKETSKADWKMDFDAFIGTAPGVAPANTVLPVITGTAQVGQTLTVSDGTWTGTPAPTYTYAWKADGVAIVGATASTYVVLVGDVGKVITAVVTASNGVAVSATSAGTAAVIA